MAGSWDTVGPEGLKFFGKVTASVSHEIKNVLAIINESAGLLDDFILMAAKGKPFNQELFNALPGRIRAQVQRADGIMKNINQFAHSIDEPEMVVEVREVVELVLALAQRYASQKGVALEAVPATGPISLLTRPFFLENLIWCCLDQAIKTAGKEKKVLIGAQKKGNQIEITFTGSKEMDYNSLDSFPTEREEALAAVLRAELLFDPRAGAVQLILGKGV
ncbi:MAG: sensor histidine kinase [Desulfobacteraceae bacterium]|nr:MAG: sensor histidine kinase [Desulfobacteraceae bacterium]